MRASSSIVLFRAPPFSSALESIHATQDAHTGSRPDNLPRSGLGPPRGAYHLRFKSEVRSLIIAGCKKSPSRRRYRIEGPLSYFLIKPSFTANDLRSSPTALTKGSRSCEEQ